MVNTTTHASQDHRAASIHTHQSSKTKKPLAERERNPKGAKRKMSRSTASISLQLNTRRETKLHQTPTPFSGTYLSALQFPLQDSPTEKKFFLSGKSQSECEGVCIHGERKGKRNGQARWKKRSFGGGHVTGSWLGLEEG